DRLFVDGICFAPDSAPVEPSTAKLELISTIKRESAIRSVIAALLTHNRRPIGCLLLGRYRVRRWQASEIEQIKVAADRLSAMFSSARASYQAADSVGQSSKGRKGELGISAGLLDTLLQNIPNGIVYLDQ